MEPNTLMLLLFVAEFTLIFGNIETTTIKDVNETVSAKSILGWHRKLRPRVTTATKKPKPAIVPHSMVYECTTPNQERGFCEPIKECKILMDELENKHAKEFLRKSQCNNDLNTRNKDTWVCCGSYGNYRNQTTTKPKPKSENPLPKKCGTQKIIVQSRILGGKEANLGEFPWMARLKHRSKTKVKSFGCGGSLIHSKYVLTAAHCIDGVNVEVLGPLFEVQLGEHNTETEIDCNNIKTKCADKPQTIRVKCNIVHPKYKKENPSHHNDIALVRLRKAAKLTDFVYPICLSRKQLEKPQYVISGWGKTQHEMLSKIKMKVNLQHFPIEECKDKYSGISISVTDNQICAGGKKNKDSCNGDSGGPLMLTDDDETHFFAAGVVSYGLGCGREGWPGVYTNAAKYYSWITNEIKKRAVGGENETSTVKGNKRTRNLNLCPKV